MDGSRPSSLRPPPATFVELFTPKLVTVLRDGYGLRDLRADAVAGLTVAIVALPLSMAIAIASGLSPEKGLITAIVGGFLVSLLGGSRFQIGGPAGAFIVLVYSIVERHGHEGLVLATLMAGAMMMAVGFLRLGAYVKYIPLPVTVGFTAGIAVIIFASQVKELLGLEIVREPAALLPKLTAVWGALGTVKPATVAMAVLALAIIVVLRRIRPGWPGFLIAVLACAALTGTLGLDIATIGSRFGEIPSMLPAPALPSASLERVRELLPDAMAIALLGSIESLLSAVVADGMTGRRHRSNCELVAQGVGNIAAALFGGMPVTGTIARTATNVRTGARGPVSGMLHAVYLLVFMLVAAPLAAHVPLAALGAVLAVVAWNMAEKEEFRALLSASRGDALVLLSTFLLTILEDLTVGIAVGVTLSAFLFMHRMAEATDIEDGARGALEDRPDAEGGRTPYRPADAAGGLMVYKASGALFFGATATMSMILDRVGSPPGSFVLDLSEVTLIDTTAAKALEGFARKLAKGGTRVLIAGARPPVRRALLHAGLREPLVGYASTVADARLIHRETSGDAAAPAPPHAAPT